MPIHEFACHQCGYVTDHYVTSDPHTAKADCAGCGSSDTRYAGLSACNSKVAKDIGPVFNGKIVPGPWGKSKRHKDRVKVFK